MNTFQFDHVKPNDPTARAARDEPGLVDELTVVYGAEHRHHDGGESEDDSHSGTTSAATVIEVVEACDGVSRSGHPEDDGNVDKLISVCSIRKIPLNDDATEVCGDVFLSPAVAEWVTQVTNSSNDSKKECSDDIMLVAKEEITDGVNDCGSVIEETDESIGINDQTTTVSDQASDRENVTIETNNPDGSIFVLKQNLNPEIENKIALNQLQEVSVPKRKLDKEKEISSVKKRMKTSEVPEENMVVVDQRQSAVNVEPSANDPVNKVSESKKKLNVKSKSLREVNFLLGDEGALNMIYSLEKRKSGDRNSMKIPQSPLRTKKDNMVKTELVKNAMLKMSPSSSLISTNCSGQQYLVEKKCTRNTINSQDSIDSTCFLSRKSILGNKSKIIRKHSSSSEVSSVSDSPIQSKRTNKSVTAKIIINQKVKKQPVSSKMIKSLDESITHGVDNFLCNEIAVQQFDGVVHITLMPKSTVMKNALNISVMKELMSVLNGLQNDDTCKLVLVSSAGKIFCHGLDVSLLIHDDPIKCKKVAVEISLTIKKFITCLSEFPKLLVAGVDGAAIGLGATMLAHFDLVFASNQATFETPYAQLGHIPEGAATTILDRLLVAELIIGSQRLTAKQAHYYGLVTRILWPDRFYDELVPLVKALAEKPLQAMKISKSLLKQKTKKILAKALKSETDILVQQWIGDECQQNLQRYFKDSVDNNNYPTV